MAAPLVHINFPGITRGTLGFDAGVFEGGLSLDSYKDHGRTDGPPHAVAYGVSHGVVFLAGSNAPEGEPSVRCEGLLFSLLGTAEPAVLHEWFDDLCDGGMRIDSLVQRSWDGADGQVTDRHGMRWLIGYEAKA